MRDVIIKIVCIILVLVSSMSKASVAEVKTCSIDALGIADFLSEWESQAKNILAKNGVKIDLERKYFTHGRASIDVIKSIESRFGVAFSKQMLEFYRYSDGLSLIRSNGTTRQRLFSISKIQTYEEMSPGAAEEWTDGKDSYISDKNYFVYGDQQKPYNVRLQYLKSAIALSEEAPNSTVLLNPEVVFETGEIEIWDLSPYIDGAKRFDGFNSFLENECKVHLKGLVDYFSSKS